MFGCIDRMPTPIGEFISERVYDRMLRSEHLITSRDCVAFVNVKNGKEIRSGGTSWKVVQGLSLFAELQ